MPMYEYACRKCGHLFEKLVKSMSGDSVVDCPACRSKQTDRKLSVFAVKGDRGARGATQPMPGCGRCGGPGPCGMG